MREKTFYIGVDLGATKTLAVLYDEDMGLIAQARAKTPSDKGGDAILASIVELASEACAQAGLDVSKVKAVGVAVPAPIDRESGTIIQAPNMGIKDYPMGKKLAKALGASSFLENDVRAGVWGEFRKGALRGYKNAVGIFVGTGIGGGILLDGKLWGGSHGHAGEIGHMILQEGGAVCGCGQYGCLEALASRSAMAKDAVAAIASGKSPLLMERYGTDFRKMKSSVFEYALSEKDEAIQKIIARSAFWVGIGMANLVNVLDPEAIVLGGGVIARFGDFYKKRAEESMKEHMLSGFAKGVKVLVSELGDLAVPTGAALSAKEAMG